MFHFTRYPTHSYVLTMRPCGIPHMRFPHSEISGSKVAYHLPEAYRRLLRPSSAHFVKPFTVCPYDALQPPVWDRRLYISLPYLIVKVRKNRLARSRTRHAQDRENSVVDTWSSIALLSSFPPSLKYILGDPRDKKGSHISANVNGSVMQDEKPVKGCFPASSTPLVDREKGL